MIRPGRSFADAEGILIPRVSMDGRTLRYENDPASKWSKTDFKTLRIDRLEPVKEDSLLQTCKLGENSKLMIVVDIECVEFESRVSVFREGFDPNDLDKFKDRDIATIPFQIIRAGCVIHLMIVATDPAPEDLTGCNQRGGILFSWRSTFPPSHHGTVFPIRQERVEGLWNLEFRVEDVGDLSKHVRSALCLKVDGRGFSGLLGDRADASVIRQTSNWLMVEACTNMIMQILAREELVEYFDQNLPSPRVNRAGASPSQNSAERKKRIDYLKNLDPRSVESLLVRLFSHSSATPAELREKFLQDPAGLKLHLRESFVRRIREDVE